MAKHTVFSDDEDSPEQPQGQQQTLPPPPAVASTSKRALESPPSALNGVHLRAPRAEKKKKIIKFTESDEEEATGSHTAITGPSFAKDGQISRNGSGGGGSTKGTPNGKSLAFKEKKQKLRAEAERLRPQREQLPIWQGKDAILEAIETNPTVVILAETGSGKTTQVPQFILNSSISTQRPRVCVTQPRRVAATSLAQRVSAEVGCALGSLVGYTVRFDDNSNDKTRLKYMTDGSLLAEMLSDRDLDRYEVVILDEAHERSLRTDMLMGFLKQIQQRRQVKVDEWNKSQRKGKDSVPHESERHPTPLKIVIMSATIDAKRFSDFFNQAPVLYVKGKQYQVRLWYSKEPVIDYSEAALKTIFEIHTLRPAGDVLVFLPGQEDIENLSASIKKYLPDLATSFPKAGSLLVLPLYAKLPPQEQAKAFLPAPPNTRKVILSTNVAETSVTIPGIVHVIDCGLAKEKFFHANVGIDTLIAENISQSSAIQRAGRAGRERNGFCYRLYTEEDFKRLPEVATPEIQRVSMTFAILHILAAGQEDVFKFDFMDSPSEGSIKTSLQILLGLEALDNSNKITKLGKSMAGLPLDPQYARILLAAFDAGCPSDIIDLVALVGLRDQLFINSFEKREAANLARKKFHHRSGDHMMLLNILRAYEDVETSDQKKWCDEHFLSLRALRQVLEARRQLRERCERVNLDWTPSVGDDSDVIISTCMTGMFPNTAIRQSDSSYKQVVGRQIIKIHPSSVIHGKNVSAFIYDELVLTSNTFARGCSRIEPSWIRLKAPNLFNREAGASNMDGVV
ncbi:P-loop containing nucleoside triphosphate hydrolase protein [Meredithblackwellia eburnea MCA 4105]